MLESDTVWSKFLPQENPEYNRNKKIVQKEDRTKPVNLLNEIRVLMDKLIWKSTIIKDSPLMDTSIYTLINWKRMKQADTPSHTTVSPQPSMISGWEKSIRVEPKQWHLIQIIQLSLQCETFQNTADEWMRKPSPCHLLILKQLKLCYFVIKRFALFLLPFLRHLWKTLVKFQSWETTSCMEINKECSWTSNLTGYCILVTYL